MIYSKDKAVSEIVAVILLALVMISLGSVIIIKFTNTKLTFSNIMESQVELAKNIQQQAIIDVFYAVYNKTENALYILVNVGNGYIEIKSIYVNNTLINNKTSIVYVNGINVQDTQSITLNSNDVNEIKVIPPLALDYSLGSKIVVQLTTSTGSKAIVVGKVVS